MRNDVQFGGVVSWNGRNELLSAAVDLSSGDAIPHHYLFTASLLRSCLTLSYKGLMFKVIVCQKTFLLASNTNPPPPPEVRKPQETWLQIWRIFSLTSTSITPKLKFGREKEPSDTESLILGWSASLGLFRCCLSRLDWQRTWNETKQAQICHHVCFKRS